MRRCRAAPGKGSSRSSTRPCSRSTSSAASLPTIRAGTRHTLQRQLIDAVNLPSAAFRYLEPDEPDLARHCLDYDAAIGDGFDLMVLGIGLNGHLGMNEPGSPVDSPTRRVELHGTTIQSSARYFTHLDLPRWGLTVGLKAVRRRRKCGCSRTERPKREIIQRTVRGEIGTANPASLLRTHPNCSLFVDRDAGALLGGAPTQGRQTAWWLREKRKGPDGPSGPSD